MMARKKRITIIIVAIVLTILVMAGILLYLYLKTDSFKSNEKLFSKYFMQVFNVADVINNENYLGIEEELNNNKYISETKGKIEYTKNLETDSENKNSTINKIGLNVKSNIDKANNYSYKNIEIGTDEENYIGLEYLKSDEKNGIRLKDIQQFVSNEDEENKIAKELGIENLNLITSEIDINSIINFSAEEKQNLINTYTPIIAENVSKDKFYRQKNTIITIEDGNMETNAYYIKLTIEEYNNLYIKVLEQLEKDEIILSKIDSIENAIKEKYPSYTAEEDLKTTFTKKIEAKIKDIQNTNIGNDEVKITVYENDGITVRMGIEKSTEKIIVDLYGGPSAKIDILEIGYETSEKTFKIEKNNTESTKNTLVKYENKKNDEILNSIQLDYKQNYNGDNITEKTELTILKDKYKGQFNLESNIKLVQDFENQITLDKDNIELNKLQEQQSNIIFSILKENMKQQLESLYSVASAEDYKEMLQNLGVIRKNAIQISDNGEVTELERKRFNSQFEFFVSKDLTSDNINELINTTKDNFEDMKVLLKSGEIQDLDMDKLSSNSDSSDYKKNIDEILFYIKRNSNNDEKANDAREYLDKTDNKYTVTIENDSQGLAKIIRAKIQEK